jgi:Carboxypeptidase regulatory-like domain
MRGTNAAWTTTTSDSGAYEFLDLRTGTYDISIAYAGFEEDRQTGIILQVGHAITVNVSMKLGSVNQAVTVTGQKT